MSSFSGHPLEFRRPSSIITSADVDDSKWNSVLESSLEEGSNFSIPPDLIQVIVFLFCPSHLIQT